MFGKEKAAAEKQRRLDAYTQEEQKFSAEIATAETLADPAERLLKLAEIEQAMAQHAVMARANAIYNNGVVVTLSGVAVGGALVLGCLPLLHIMAPVAIGMGLTGDVLAAGGSFGDKIRNKRITKERQAEAEVHLGKVNRLAKSIAASKETLVREQAERITQSPLYEQVLELPGLSKIFAGAAAKQVEKLKEDLAAAQKKAARLAKQQEGSEPLKDYKKFKNLLEPKGK